MPGFPLRLIIQVLKLLLQLLEWFLSDNDEEKKKIESG